MDKLMTCAEVAVRYGIRVETVWMWVRSKKLPAVKIGKQYLFRMEDITAFEKEGETVKQHESAT